MSNSSQGTAGDDVWTVWTIYQNPSDYPGKWVLRAHDHPGGARAECYVCDTLNEARSFVPRGLTRLSRHLSDDPVIRETWI